MITRRGFLFSGASLSVATGRGFANDFWNDKDPAAWSEKDIQRLLTNSPWSREVALHFRGDSAAANGRRGGRGPTAGSGGEGGQWDASNSGSMGGPPIGGGSGGAGGGGGRGMRGGGAGMGDRAPGGRPEMRVTVRWESAKPVRDARKKPVRPEDSGFYVISAGALPATEGAWGTDEGSMSPEERKKRAEQHLRDVTRLERKNQDPIGADRVGILDSNGVRYLVFYFPHGPHPIVPDDKEVSFVTSLGTMEIRAKFILKNMVVRSELAV